MAKKLKICVSMSVEDKGFLGRIAAKKNKSLSGVLGIAVAEYRLKLGRRDRRQLKVAL